MANLCDVIYGSGTAIGVGKAAPTSSVFGKHHSHANTSNKAAHITPHNAFVSAGFIDLNVNETILQTHYKYENQ